MSGLVKTVKKHFRKMAHFAKKYWKIIAIAVAVYFTAGLALSAFPATASFAASLPGFAGGGFAGLGIGAGATAGTGIFSQIATGIGLGGGLASGAAAAGGTTAAVGTGVAAGTGGAAAGGAAAGAGAGAIEGVTVVGSAGGGIGAGTAAAGAAGIAGGAAAAAGGGSSASPAVASSSAKTGMSFADKLLLASTGTSAIGSLLGPSEKDLINAQKQFSGSFYGVDSKGGGGAVAPPEPQLIAKRKVEQPAAGTPGQPATQQLPTLEEPDNAVTPPPTQAANQRQLIPPAQDQQGAERLPTLQTKTNDTRDLFASQMPGVRYVG